MKKLDCSVLMSVYEKDTLFYLRESINSILNQTHVPTEFVIIKDGPLSNDLDKYLGSLKSNQSVNFKVISLPKNLGLAKALNIGVTHCINDIIFRQDADDISLPNRFNEQYSFLKANKNIALLSSWTDAYDSHLNIKLFTRKVPEFNNDIILYSKNRTPFNHPSSVFRKSFFKKTKGYPTHKNYSEDWWLALRMLKKGFYLHNLQKVLVKVRAPNDWFQRRRGLTYAKIEINDQICLYKEKLISLIDLIKNLLIRLPTRIFPLFLTKLIYKIIRIFR